VICVVIVNVIVNQIVDMDKLLIDQYGNAILYKVDTNSIKNVSDNFECRTMYVA
jgi:hypothetical protein